MMRFHRKFEEIILCRYPRKTNEIETEANGTKRNNNEVAIGNKLSECYLMLRCASRAILGPHEANKNDGKFIAKN